MIKLMCTLSPFTSRPGCSLNDFKSRAERCMKVCKCITGCKEGLQCSGLSLSMLYLQEGCKKWYDAVYSTAVPADSVR